MKDKFKDLLSTKGVEAVMLLDSSGSIVFNSSDDPFSQTRSGMNWPEIVGMFNGINESEVIFETTKVYFLRTETGIIVVFTESTAPMAMVRLNCNILLPELNIRKKRLGGLGKIFKRKRSG